MTERVLPSGWSTTWTLAAITWKRLLRGRALWVAIAIAALPVLFATLMRARRMTDVGIEDLFAFEELLLAVIPAMFVASSIGEEIEDRTTTYLWSRPIARWSVLAGKLLALAPVAMAIMVGSWYIAVYAGMKAAPLPASCLALALGALVVSLIAAALSTLVPKHGMALTVCYLLFFDLPLSAIPASLRELSVTNNVRVIAGLWAEQSSVLQASIELAVIAAVWSFVGLRRIRRIEA